MSIFTKSLLVILGGALAAVVVGGCAKEQEPAPTSELLQTQDGVWTCRDCTISIEQEPVTDSAGRLVGRRPRMVMECPDCRDVVRTMDEIGSTTHHTCSTCGDSTLICSMH